ncbi:hypothetical protein B296_00011554 [Ensete ventricosum]|uniref:Uncharacterized protein n=1 Tax=Ensete ventricosum TaxID=4639 RepID=A0A426ZP84_ENSVE|nr:hypothetical protein B296_00011554 [Ensete ventricosum]
MVQLGKSTYDRPFDRGGHHGLLVLRVERRWKIAEGEAGGSVEMGSYKHRSKRLRILCREEEDEERRRRKCDFCLLVLKEEDGVSSRRGGGEEEEEEDAIGFSTVRSTPKASRLLSTSCLRPRRRSTRRNRLLHHEVNAEDIVFLPPSFVPPLEANAASDMDSPPPARSVGGSGAGRAPRAPIASAAFARGVPSSFSTAASGT